MNVRPKNLFLPILLLFEEAERTVVGAFVFFRVQRAGKDIYVKS